MGEERRLWMRRQEEGDTEIRAGQQSTRAHWTVLEQVPYFERASREVAEGDNYKYRVEMENDLTTHSIDKILEHVYLYNSFTSRAESDCLLDFCYFIQEGSLQIRALDKSLASISRHTCLDSYRLGHALRLPPIKRKAWKTAVELGLTSEVEMMLRCSRSYLDQSINMKYQTALHASIERGYESQARLLIENKANHSLRDYQEKCVLGLVAWHGRSGLAEILLEYGASVNTSDMWGQTPLHKACGRGHDAVVRILAENGADINTRSKSGHTALHVAAMGGYRNIVLTLLQYGAAWDLSDAQWQLTALHMAAYRGHADLVKQLSDLFSYKRDTIGFGGRTPLHVAIEEGHAEVVSALLKCDGLIMAPDWQGRTPLHYAAKLGRAQMIRELVRAGGSLTDRDYRGMTCLHLAAQSNHTQALTTLLQYKNCPVNSRNKDGMTALNYAAGNGSVLMIRKLLKAGAVPTLLNKVVNITKSLVDRRKLYKNSIKILLSARV